MIDFHTDYTDFTESHIATLAAVGNLTKNASLHSRLPADKPAVVASDAHFASAAKPTTASLLRCSLRELREICVRQKADYLIEIDKKYIMDL